MLDKLREKFSQKITGRIKDRFDSLSNSATSTSISVNQLSILSDQMEKLTEGETVKKIAVTTTAVLSAFFVADLVALLIEKALPPPPVSILASRSSQPIGMGSPMDFEVVISRNLFSSKEPKAQTDEVDLEAEPVLTSLPWNLVGTVIFQNPNRSMAAIQDKDENKVYPIRPGDFIEEKAEILSVDPVRVVFINKMTRRKEMVELPEDQKSKIQFSTPTKRSASTGIKEVQENKFLISRAEVESQMSNLNALMTQALATPEMVGGQMIGFRLKQIQAGSFYEKIGLKINDIITSVNGEKITDAAKALSLLQDLKSMNSLDLGIKRNGKDTLLNYDIQ